MPLTQKHRSSIYQSLSPILGEEEAEALLSQFPAADGDELVTRSMLIATESTLRAEISGLRAEMHELFRQHTIWFAGSVVAGMGLSATIASLI